MLSETVIEFDDVWKKYSKSQVFHNTLRDEMVNVFKTLNKKSMELHEGDFWALQGINLDVKRGECIGLYGPNGSGKSTILKLMANVTYPTRGSVTVKGKVAPLIELGAGFHNDLSGRENVYMNGTIIGMSIRDIKEKMQEVIEFSELQDFIDIPVKKYSSGMYLRLAFSIAIHSKAEIFLFDEILTVGDESFQTKCLQKIADLKSKKRTMLIVSHDHNGLKSSCDRIIYLQKGVMQPSYISNVEG